MRKRFKEQVEQASELRTLFILLVLLSLHVWRIIPTLRPHQIIIPATISQIFIFIIASFNIEQFIPIFAIGNMLIVGIALFPSTFPRPKNTVHWTKADDRLIK